jgi:myosin heavy subunit
MPTKAEAKRQGRSLGFKQDTNAWWVQPGDLDIEEEALQHPGVWLCTVVDVNATDVTLRKEPKNAVGEDQPDAGAERTFKNSGERYFLGPADEAYAAKLDDNFPYEGITNMTELRELNEAELDRNLRTLHHHHQNYCYCGQTLVAINPFGKPNRSLFSDETKDTYVGKDREEIAPHIYAVAETAFQQAFKPATGGDKPKQALVITGESGAGKTFTTKQALAYLAEVGQAEARGGRDPVHIRMVKSNVVLDAFGNATMPRNDDSSRFGKLFKIYFSKQNRHVTGCSIDPYLLEKGRLSKQSHKERNFHVMYQLLSGTDAGQKTEFHLKDWDDYRYLNRFIPPAHEPREAGRKYSSPHQDSDTLMGPKLTDEDPEETDPFKFGKLADQFAKAGFNPQEINMIWRVCSCCLLLGELNVVSENGSSALDAPKAQVANMDVLETIANLLYIPPEELVKAATIMTRSGGNKVYVSEYTVGAAISSIRTFAWNLYDGLFNYLVDRLSEDLREDRSERDASVAVLDIFGFEFTPTPQLKPPFLMNSFEQFCINLCNEKLQQQFVKCVLKTEQDIYFAELGEHVHIDFEDNSANLSAIKNISKLLDDTTNANRQGIKDTDFHDKLASFFEGTGRGRGSSRHAKEDGVVCRMVDTLHGPGKEKKYHNSEGYGFILKHYAAEVLYDELGWLDKNKGKLSEDVISAYKGSIREGAPTHYPATYWAERDAGTSAKSTVVSSFAAALDTLILELNDSTCYFTRCIKSNRAKVGGLYEGALVLNQLRYTGMLDTLVIRRLGYPNRFVHAVFLDRYWLLHRDAPDLKALVDYLKTTDTVISNGGADSIRVGTTKVLMRDDVVVALDAWRREKMYDSAVVVQAVYKARQYKLIYAAKREICVQLRPLLKGGLDRKKFRVAYHEKFEKQERHMIQCLINATVHRQTYYLLKKKYEMVQAQLAELWKAHESSTSLHQRYIDGISAKLEKSRRSMAEQLANLQHEQDQKVAAHAAKMATINETNKQLQATLQAKQADLENQRQASDRVSSEGIQKQKDLEQAAAAAELAWKKRREEEESKLADLQAQPALLRAENAAKIAVLKADLEAMQKQCADEEAIISEKHSITQQEIADAAEELALIKEQGEIQERKNKENLAWLQEEMATIDQRHADERENLKKQLASQNWKLAQLRMKEAQAEDQYNTLQRHGAMGVFGAAPQQREVDILEAKIEQVRETLSAKAAQFDHKMEMVKGAMQAEQDAAAAWDVSKQEHKDKVAALQAAIAAEKKVSTDLEEQAIHVAPQLTHRTSRFQTRTYEEVTKPAEYILPGAPPPPPPSDLPTSPVKAAARPSRFDSFGPYGSSIDIARATDPVEPQHGVLSTTQAATVSALYTGGLREWPAKGMETMDPTTLRHALRLLR